MEKLIITCAICGAEVKKEHNPAVPYTVKEIGEQARLAYEAGASIIHLHVREDDGTPTQCEKRFKLCIDEIKKHCDDVIIQVSTGGAVGMTANERLQPLNLRPQMASLDCGTCNFGGDEIFINTESMIIEFAKKMIDLNVKPECEIFDKGMIDHAIKLNKKGFIPSPMHFNFVMGTACAINATAKDLLYLSESIPSNSTFTVSGIGKSQISMATMAIILGGHVRVGLEDNVYLKKGVLIKDNGEIVKKIVNIARELNREIASPSEARKILSIQGE